MIGIIFIGDLKYCPYLNKYIQIFDENKVDYDIIFWNRSGDNLTLSSNYISYNKSSVLNRNPIEKISDFIEYKFWLEKLLISKGYEKLVVLTTLTGVLLYKSLLKNFKGKYIFDIRDYSYESLIPFYKMEEKLIRNSYFTCISSHGFKEFLPRNYNYVIAHNFNYADLIHKKHYRKKKENTALNVVFNGSIRYFDHQSLIINKLKNDNRFKMIYHGTGPELEIYKSYCKDNKINNIEFTGEYKNSDKYKLLEDADILNNSYGTKKLMEVKYAISNKYYDGIIYGIPQLVEDKTFKCNLTEKIGIGVGLNVYDENFADRIYNYYFRIDEENFNISCNDTLDKIISEDNHYLEKIKDFTIEK